LAEFIKEVFAIPIAKEYGALTVMAGLSSSKLYLGGTEGEGIPAGEEAEVARAYMTALFSKGWAKPGPGDNWCLLETHNAPNICFSSHRSDDTVYIKQLDKKYPEPTSSGGFISAGQA